MEQQMTRKGYKKTELGEIPEDWLVKPLETFTSFISYGFTNPMPTSSSGPFMVTARDINSGRVLYESARQTTEEAYKNLLSPKSQPKLKDILLTKDGTLGRLALVEKEGICINQSVALLRPNDRIDPAYLKKLLESPPYQKKMIEDAGGSTIKHIYITIVNRMAVAVPASKLEQTAIAKTLSDVDNLITSLEKLIAKKRDIKTATMQQLLTGKTRLPGFDKHPDGKPKGMQKTELGEIPEDWNVKSLLELLKQNPKYGINAAAVPLSGNLPTYIRITDISEDGYFKPSPKMGVDNPFSDEYQLSEGDILLARTGASVGKSYLFRTGDGKLVYAGFLIKISPDETFLSPSYLFHYFKTEPYWQWVTIMSMRSGQPGINSIEYGQQQLPIPPREEQTSIANALSDMDNEIEAISQRVDKTKQIKQGMMQELLTGRTRLI